MTHLWCVLRVKNVLSLLRDILEAIFTDSPKMLYRGVLVPTTPAAHEPASNNLHGVIQDYQDFTKPEN